MNIVESTAAYEAWVKSQVPIVAADLARKHDAMRRAPFPFLRGTFYRWSQLWAEACPALAAAPRLLAVGDLHIENFGTWRDAEGRLIWGINDFDEAARMPYTIDLVRLATSAILAHAAGDVRILPADACASMLVGYADALAKGGQAFVLEEGHATLRQLALGAERDPTRFWARTQSWKRSRAVPAQVRALIGRQIPSEARNLRIVHRIAGLGSLGRQRFVGLAEWDGGLIAREAKSLLPSAYRWAQGKKNQGRIRYADIVARSVRCRDPLVSVNGTWLLRRIGPHCSRIELADIPRQRDESHFLECMGRELANVHLGTPDAVAAIRSDLRRRKAGWLHAAAETMAEVTDRDWRRWRARG